ncbi:trans-sulfuration enzyme family protein [Woodsholea maritima]|uniref:trans-sulfuration enzyme family protein n=1 Tax=Woodsholea maritima TaxID=240237 RepID=UPI000371550C|nr:PLP-dependent transferase [Woodsholea maritima]
MTEKPTPTERFETRAARAGINRDPGYNSVVAPICVSATFIREDATKPGGFDYARTNNPTRQVFADAVTALEGGAGTVATTSGMAAIDLLFNDLPIGARIVAAHDCYGGTHRLLDARAQGGRFSVDYVDCTDLAALAAALESPAHLLLLETPSNPRIRITDLEAAAKLGKAAGAIVAVDNTVLSPALQRPLELGADVVVSSATKLINGHSDMIGGVLTAKDPDHAERYAWWANAAGTGAAAFDCFLALRGLRTLPLRAKAQSDTALKIAQFLDAHPHVLHVDYPGLASHPGHEIAKRQQSAFGPLLAFEVKGGLDGGAKILRQLNLFTLAQSLGGAESLINVPALMTHKAMTQEARDKAGVKDGLLRISAGLEAAEDLIADLDQALQALD